MEPEFYNRKTGRIEREHVYGDAWLRWVYGSPLGRASLEVLLKRSAFSRVFGAYMDLAVSKKKIQPFVDQYGIKAEEAELPLEAYPNFNAFFARKLKPEARPISEGDSVVVFPADARHLLIPDMRAAHDVFIKGQAFDLLGLVGGDEVMAHVFAGGAAVISRLCPVDYHRFHFPVSGLAGGSKPVRGDLYSVSPLALSRVPGVLWRNARMLTLMEDTVVGRVLVIEVGATCVGSMVQTYQAESRITKGAEKGYFRFGGSTTITLFERGKVSFAEDLVSHSAQGRELYALMGDRMGTA